MPKRRTNTKEETITLRVTASEKAELQAAAQREDATLSYWLIELGLHAARAAASDGKIRRRRAK